jgi:hypothetical protein
VNLEDTVVNQYLFDPETREGKDERTMSAAFVPICTGLTQFYIGALTDAEEPQLAWNDAARMPNGLLLSLSFASLVQLEDGSFYLPEESIVYRTVAVDRMRPIAYKFVAKTFNPDPNELNAQDPNDPNSNPPQADKSTGSPDDVPKPADGSTDAFLRR